MSDDFMREKGGGTVDLFKVDFDLFTPGAAKRRSSDKSESSSTRGPRLVRKDEEPPPVPTKFEHASSSEGALRRARVARTIRHFTDVLSQELGFYPIASVTYRGSGETDFDPHDPVVCAYDPGVRQKMEYVPRRVWGQLEGRYVYLLLDSESLVAWFDNSFFAQSDEHINNISLQVTGKPRDELGQTPFVVTRVFRVVHGRYQEAPIQKVRELAPQDELPSFGSGRDSFRLKVYGNQVVWAYGSPFLLTEEQIAKLEAADWPKFSKVAVGPNVGVKVGDRPGLRLVAQQEPGGTEPAVYVSGIPVVDPLLILRNLGGKYAVACDDVHSHHGQFEDEAESMLRFKRYEAAVGVLPLIRNRANAMNPVAKAHAVSSLEWVIQEFEEEGESLAREAEAAAESLISWLSSKPMQFIEALVWSCPDDRMLRAYQAYAKTYCQVLERMWETERGKTYVGSLLDEVEGPTPRTSGGAKIVADFVLRPEESSSDAITSAARSISGVVAGAFGALCPAIVKRTLLETSTAHGSSSAAALQRAVEQLNAALGETVLSVEVMTTTVRSGIGVSGSSFRGGQGLELQVERPMLKVTELKVKEVGAAVQRFNVILESLNAVLLVGAIREALKREGRDDITTAADALRLVKSVVSLSEGYVTLRGVKTVTARKVAEALAGRLALVGAAVDFVASSADAIQNFRTGDGDAAAGNIATATGAGVIVAALLLSSNPAGWVVAGILLGTAGSAWASAFDDTPFDKLLAHSPFGRSPLTDRLEADDPAWTLTTTNYTDWDRQTPAGVEKFLEAAQQLQFAFSVRGAMPSGPLAACDAAFEITAHELLAESTFHIEYDVTYEHGAGRRRETKSVRGYLLLMSLGDEPFLADYPEMPDRNRTNFEMTGVVEIENGVIKVNLRPSEAPRTSDDQVMMPHNVTLRVRLDVHGDAYEGNGGQNSAASLNKGEKASLVVPTTAGGKRWVRFERVAGEQPEEVTSYIAEFIHPAV